ncbi:MAG TPA: fimbria/pilus periplasmic chaperone [Croceibacterium sp.]
MTGLRIWKRVAAAVALTGVSVGPAHASGLQVEPTSVTIAERSEEMWLINTGDAPLQAQVRVYRWVQDAEGERLEPTEDLLASPPMAQLAPGSRRLVRLVSTGAKSCEDTFRLAIDELPAPQSETAGLRYVMHYSVPVFVTPERCEAMAPQLSWRIETRGPEARLVVDNGGTMHAQLADLTFIDPNGQRTPLTPGLLGYVLAEAQMGFALAPSAETFVRGGTIEALVNGNRIEQPVAPASAAAD